MTSSWCKIHGMYSIVSHNKYSSISEIPTTRTVINITFFIFPNQKTISIVKYSTYPHNTTRTLYNQVCNPIRTEFISPFNDLGGKITPFGVRTKNLLTLKISATDKQYCRNLLPFRLHHTRLSRTITLLLLRTTRDPFHKEPMRLYLKSCKNYLCFNHDSYD